MSESCINTYPVDAINSSLFLATYDLPVTSISNSTSSIKTSGHLMGNCVVDIMTVSFRDAHRHITYFCAGIVASHINPLSGVVVELEFDMAAEADYTKPLATVLYKSIMPIHGVIANSRPSKALSSGEIPKVEYVKLLMMLWHLYNALEQALDQHATHPAIETTYNPALLSRVDALSSDISYLLQVPEDAWQYHPIHVELAANTPPALSTYLKRIDEIANAPAASSQSGEKNHGVHVKGTDAEDTTKAEPRACVAQLLSHAYVRYLGDISGGQNVRYALGKAYNLELDSTSVSGPGVSFYAFKELRSNKVANLGEMKRIVTWFKDGINVAGEKIGVESKRAIVSEAKYAFELSAGLLECLNITEPKRPESVLYSTSPENRFMSRFMHDIQKIVILILALYALQYAWAIGLGRFSDRLPIHGAWRN